MLPLVEWLQGGGSGIQAVAWYVTIDQANYTAVQTNLFEVVGGAYVVTDPVGVTWSTVVPVSSP